MMANDLREMTLEVLTARTKLGAIRERLNYDRKQWEETNAWQFAQLEQATESLGTVETALRDATVQAFNATGDKHPGPGLGIRVVSKLEYDSGVAFDWALEHKLALKLDSPTFEKIAKSNSLPFVAVTDQPTATIATDLEKALEEGVANAQVQTIT